MYHFKKSKRERIIELGWREIRGRWYHNQLNEDSNGLSLDEVKIFEQL